MKYIQKITHVLFLVLLLSVFFKKHFSYYLLEQFRYHHTKYYKSFYISLADLSCQDELGYGFLHYAVVFGKPLLVQLLKEKHINPNIQTKDGLSALHLASIYGMNITTKALLEIPSINTNIQDKYGNSPLIYASKRGALGVAKYLVQAKANPNQMNYFSQTPLSIANNRRFYYLTTYFIQSTGFGSYHYKAQNLLVPRHKYKWTYIKKNTYIQSLFSNAFVQKYIMRMNLPFITTMEKKFSARKYLFKDKPQWKRPDKAFRWLLRKKIV